MCPAHWSHADDHITVHTVEAGLMRDAAPEFRDKYVTNMRQLPGWSVRAVGADS